MAVPFHPIPDRWKTFHYTAWPLHGSSRVFRKQRGLWSARVETAHPLAAIGRPFFPPIFIQLVSRGQSISPITSSQSWHVPHPRILLLARVLPPLFSLFKFNFSAECIESTPERHLVSSSSFFFCSFPRNFPLYFLRGTDFRSTHVFLFFYLEKKFLSYILSFWMSVLRSKMIKEMYFEYISNKVLVESWISDRASSSSFRVRYHYPRVFRDSTTSRRASRSPLRRRNRVSFENAFNLDKKHHCVQRGDLLINSTLHVITVKDHHKSSKCFTSRF